MARDRKKHVCAQEAPATVSSVASTLPGSALAPTQVLPDHTELFHHLLRALAREAARADHGAETDVIN